MLGLMLAALCLSSQWIREGFVQGAGDSVEVVRGEVGEEAWLPCDVDSNRDDSPSKVLWFRHRTEQGQGFSQRPFYKVEDTGRRGLWNAEHAIGVLWAGRASFSVARSPAALRLSRLRQSDAGAYLCTVAFHGGAQRNATVHLVVGVSPSVPVIQSSTGKRLEHKIGPFLLGDNLKLICVVEKGSPMPTVKWRRNGVLVSETAVEESSEEGNPSSMSDAGVRSALLIEGLSRDDLLTELSCEASNIIGGPFQTSVVIDLTLPPVSVRIQNRQRSFETDVSAEFRCQVIGSRPPAQVSWWLDERRLEAFVTEEHANSTVTTLLLVLTAELDGLQLTCRALNARLPRGLWEDSVLLNVYHSPRAVLRLGQGLKEDRIVEGQDVYLECSIRANPRVTEVAWTLDGEPLEAPPPLPNGTAPGIIVQDQYLVLRNVSTKFSASYTCWVKSPRGAAVSNSLLLRVQYAPRCRRQSQSVLHYSTAREEIDVICEMDADPPDLTFRWVVKNSSESRDLAPFAWNGTRSEARYKPSSSNEFVSLLCLANNTVGPHKKACTYVVEPHGAPKSLSGCLVVNQATTWFLVECAWDAAARAGRPAPDEWYVLEVFHADSGVLLANVTAKQRPTFRVGSIPPATECLALAFAVNARGRSQPQRVVVRAIPPPSKLLTSAGASWHNQQTQGLNLLSAVLLAASPLHPSSLNRLFTWGRLRRTSGRRRMGKLTSGLVSVLRLILRYRTQYFREVTSSPVLRKKRCGGNSCRRIVVSGSGCHLPFHSCCEMEEENQQELAKKKRTFRKYTYRGVDLDQLLDMTSNQLMELMHCRARRRYARGLKRKPLALIKKLRRAKKECGPLEKPEVVKTHLRDMLVVPEMVGSIVGVYNGKAFNQVEIKPEMIGHYLGEFSITYKPVKHGRPGIGATHSSRFIPLK